MALCCSFIREKIAIFVEYKMRLRQAQASLAYPSAFIIFVEYKMRLRQAQQVSCFLRSTYPKQVLPLCSLIENIQVSLASLPVFTIFAQ